MGAMGVLQALQAGVFHLPGGSNVGLLVQDDEAIAIDAGLDDSAAKEITRSVEKLGARLRAVIVTHAHADHFGGVAELVKRSGAEVYATALEAAVVRNPLLEPLYLYGGACPIRELTHKFTLAKAGGVQHILEPGAARIAGIELEIVALGGHAPQQIGVRRGEVLFTADAFFPVETLQKHGIPFCADLDAALETLTRLDGLAGSWFAPGHGPALREPAGVIAANRARLEQIRTLCLEAIGEPAEPAAILAAVADGLGVTLRDVVGYQLAQTTVLAALASLQRAGYAVPTVVGQRWRWQRAAG